MGLSWHLNKVQICFPVPQLISPMSIFKVRRFNVCCSAPVLPALLLHDKRKIASGWGSIKCHYDLLGLAQTAAWCERVEWVLCRHHYIDLFTIHVSSRWSTRAGRQSRLARSRLNKRYKPYCGVIQFPPRPHNYSYKPIVQRENHHLSAGSLTTWSDLYTVLAMQ